MHDGWEYVAAAYGVVAVTIGAWFWIIRRKLQRLRQVREERERGY